MSAPPPTYPPPAGYPQGYAPPPQQPGYQPPPGQAYQPQPGVVYTQPGQVVTNVQVVQAPPKPNDYLILSIVVLLCCNCLFGIIALIFSLQSDSAYKAGRVDEAAQKGNTAKKINIAGIVFTVILVIIIVILYVVLVATAVGTYNQTLSDISTSLSKNIDDQWNN